MTIPEADVSILNAQLKSAPHGGVEFAVLQALARIAARGDRAAINVLVEHAAHGRGVHRSHATSLLTQLSGATRTRISPAPVLDSAWPEIFDRLLDVADDFAVPYWAIAGLLHATGSKAYARVVGIANSNKLPVNLRAQAVKCLARTSGQLFDRDLPPDSGRWEENQIRLNEVNEWAASGFADGPGHSLPPRDSALDNPQTPLEHLVVRLEQRLAKERQKLFRAEDPAEPCLRLVPATPEYLYAIRALWTLPAIYLEFISRFSPLRIRVCSEEFYNDGLHLYGASELIDRQLGHAWYPDPTHPHPNWPSGHVVIADHAHDPYVIDLTRATPLDGPVLTAEHGTGSWDFRQVAPSFLAFLETVITTK